MKKVIIFTVAALLLMPIAVFASKQAEKPGLSGPEAAAVPDIKGDGKYYYYANIQAYEKETGKSFPSLKESPFIKQLGITDPVEKRVPEEPMVIMPSDAVGRYSDTLINNNATSALDFVEDLLREFPLMYTFDMMGIVPNIFQSWEVSNGAKTYVFKLRKGMKWSDGHPFTTADFMYWYNQMANNKDISPSGVQNLKVKDQHGKMTAVDDYTLRLDFVASYGIIIERICRWRPMMYAPAHYMKQFHPDFVSKADLDKKVKDGSFNSWVDLHQDAFYWYNNPETPSIFAWTVKTKVSKQVQELERNPYFWKVDVAGQQLPYFDKLHRPYVGDQEQILLKTIAGEFDYERHNWLGQQEGYSLVIQNQEKGNYRVLQGGGWSDEAGVVVPNYSHEDPVLRKIFNDKRFRIALAQAINREEINNTLFRGGFKIASQPAPPDGPPYFGENKEFHQYDAYDVAKANQLLDELGLTWNADKTLRMRPDGKPMKLTVQLLNNGWAFPVEISEMYKQYWSEIGIDITIKPLGGALYWEVVNGMQYELRQQSVNWGGRRPIIAALRCDPVPVCPSWFINPRWASWVLTGGEKGEEPPEGVKKLYQLHQDFVAEPDAAKREAITKEIYAIHNEELWAFCALKKPADFKQIYYIPVHNSIRNFAEPVAPEWYYAMPECWYRLAEYE